MLDNLRGVKRAYRLDEIRDGYAFFLARTFVDGNCLDLGAPEASLFAVGALRDEQGLERGAGDVDYVKVVAGGVLERLHFSIAESVGGNTCLLLYATHRAVLLHTVGGHSNDEERGGAGVDVFFHDE